MVSNFRYSIRDRFWNATFSGTGNPQPVIPGVLSGVPDGSECYRTYVPGEWTSAANEPAGVDFDWSVVTLRDPDASCDLGSYDVGWFGYRTRDNTAAADETSTLLRIAGYPGVPLDGATWPSLYLADGYAPGYPFWNAHVLNIDATQGQSGGPFFVPSTGQAWGIAIQEGSGVNFGLRFTHRSSRGSRHTKDREATAGAR